MFMDQNEVMVPHCSLIVALSSVLGLAAEIKVLFFSVVLCHRGPSEKCTVSICI